MDKATQPAPPRVAAKAKADEAAKKAEAANPGEQTAKRLKKWIDPKVKAAAYKNVEDIERAVINYQKTAGNVKLVAACIGATLHAEKIDKTEAEALIQRLHEISKVPKTQLKTSMKDGQPSINPEFARAG